MRSVTVTVKGSVRVTVTTSSGSDSKRRTPEQLEAVMLSSIEEVGAEGGAVMVLLSERVSDGVSAGSVSVSGSGGGGESVVTRGVLDVLVMLSV